MSSGEQGPAPAVYELSARIGPAHTDWLYHRLQISGPVEAVAAFRAAYPALVG